MKTAPENVSEAAFVRQLAERAPNTVYNTNFKPKRGKLASNRRDRSLAFTRDYISYNAALFPSELAIIQNGEEISYAAFDRNLDRFTAALRTLNLPIGCKVAVEWTTLYEHWLILLAFEALGVATFSYTKFEIPAVIGQFKEVDLVLCTEEAVPNGAKRALLLKPSWFDKIFAQPSVQNDYSTKLSPDTPIRIHCTSGTTGEMKRVVRTARVHDFRVRQYQEKEEYNRRSKFFVSHSFSVQAIYGRATACIRAGGTCVSDNRGIFQTIRERKISHIAVPPAMLVKILELCPENFEKPDLFKVSTFGGPIPNALRERLLRDLASDVIESYGTNEIGSICTFGSDNRGIAVPGVQVEVVDENDRPIFGSPGRIRVKSPGSVCGYDDDDALTERMFQNGWFYPGDLGILSSARMLKLLGREDDQINIGGFKVIRGELETRLREVIQPNDLYVTTIVNSDGVEQMCVALDIDPTRNLAELNDKIGSVLDAQWGEVLVVRVAEIPRSPAGKVIRKSLNAMLTGTPKQ